MKFLAINGSPKGEKSNTQTMVDAFFEGVSSAGGETETIYAKDLKVGFCIGCFHCWTKTPGKCIQEDDMTWVLEKIREADVVVWATPLYHFGMSAMLKAVLERTLPLADPHIVKFKDSYGHPVREGVDEAKVILMSNCGFPENHHFYPLMEQFLAMNRAGSKAHLEVITRPEGALLRVPDLADKISWYFKALYDAGVEYVKTGSLSRETKELLSKDFMPVASYVSFANKYWDKEY